MDDHSDNEPVPKSKNKLFKILPSKEALKVRDWHDEPPNKNTGKKKSSKTSGIGPMCIYIKEHGQKMCQRLEKLHKRQQNGLLDLTIVCQEKKLQAHKIVMAASSKFFCAQLCRNNILVPVILKLEDFGLDLDFDAVQHLIEFIYRGKVTIPGERLKHVCAAAHELGVYGLVDFLPASSKKYNSSGRDSNHFISLSSDEEVSEEEEEEEERDDPIPAKRRSSGGVSFNGESTPRGFVRESTSSVSTESLDPMNGAVGSSDSNSNVVVQFESSSCTNERQELSENPSPIVVQHSNQSHHHTNYVPSSQYSLEAMSNLSTNYIFPSNSNGQQQHLQFSSGQLSLQDEHSQISISTTPLDSDEVEILTTSIGNSNMSGHSFYYAAPPMSFRPYPDHKTSSDSSCGLPVVTFTSSHCPQPLISTTSYSSSTNSQHQVSSSSFQPQISKGKLRIINQEGIITNTAENIQTPSTSTSADKSVASSSCVNYKMAPCKMMAGEQLYDVDSVLEEQLFPHPVQGGSGMSLQDVDQGFVSQMSTNQTNFLSSVMPHSFVTWNPICTMANNVLGLTDDIISDSQNGKDKSNGPTQIDLTEMEDSNSWLIGGSTTSRSGHHCSETIATITEGSWTTPADPTWIPEEIVSREDGDSRTSSVSIETSLHCDPHPSTSNWHSSVDISSDNAIDKNQNENFVVQQNTEQILELEVIETHSNEMGQNSTELLGVNIPPPPALVDSRPGECQLKRKISWIEKDTGVCPEKKKGDLEVRKDLIMPTAPTTGVDNVFQPDDSQPENDIDEDSPSKASHSLSTGASEDPKMLIMMAKDFQCRECQMKFTINAQLKSHMKHAHHMPEIFSCSVCKETGFKEKESLKMHLYKTHGMGEFFRCEECNFETSIKVSYMKHVSAHAETQMNCTKCNKTFKSKAGLKLHLKQHFQEDLHKCDFCNFKTPQRVNYLKHLATKHRKTEEGEELKMNVQCALCTFKCVADYQLKSHVLRKHTSKQDMKFQCDSCDYASVERAALEKHVRFKHTNERPYLCQICGFSTHTLSAMSRHKRGHSKSKPHVCSTCGSAYADRKRLNDHMLGHSGKLPFSCDFCGFSSRRKDNLQAHIRRVHPELSHSSNSRAGGSILASKSGLEFEEQPDEVDDIRSTETPVKELEETEAKFFCQSPSEDEDKEQPITETENVLIEESKTLDRSHIVGHINRDGSIRPVVPTSSSTQDQLLPAVSPISCSEHREEQQEPEAKNVIVEKIVS